MRTSEENLNLMMNTKNIISFRYDFCISVGVLEKSLSKP